MNLITKLLSVQEHPFDIQEHPFSKVVCRVVECSMTLSKDLCQKLDVLTFEQENLILSHSCH